MVLNPPVPLRAKVLVPKPRPASKSQPKARVTLLKAEVLPRKEESRKQCWKKALLSKAVEFWCWNLPEEETSDSWVWLSGCSQTLSRKLKDSGLRKLYILHCWRQWALLDLQEEEDIWASMLKMVLCEWKRSTNAGALKGTERPSPSDLDVAAEQLTWDHPQASNFPRKLDNLGHVARRWRVNSANFYSWGLVL